MELIWKRYYIARVIVVLLFFVVLGWRAVAYCHTFDLHVRDADQIILEREVDKIERERAHDRCQEYDRGERSREPSRRDREKEAEYLRNDIH